MILVTQSPLEVSPDQAETEGIKRENRQDNSPNGEERKKVGLVKTLRRDECLDFRAGFQTAQLLPV